MKHSLQKMKLKLPHSFILLTNLVSEVGFRKSSNVICDSNCNITIHIDLHYQGGETQWYAKSNPLFTCTQKTFCQIMTIQWSMMSSNQ